MQEKSKTKMTHDWRNSTELEYRLKFIKIDFEPLLMHYKKGKWHISYWNFLNFKKIANLDHLEDKIFWVKIEKMDVLYPSHFFNFWRIFDLLKIEFWQRGIVVWNIYCTSVQKFTLKVDKWMQEKRNTKMSRDPQNPPRAWNLQNRFWTPSNAL